MYKVKIYGAGSIGNHLAHAARHLGWKVDICDVDNNALRRTKNDIYPSRYGSWDDDIGLYLNDEVPSTGYDLIFIGTPPDSHISLGLSSITEKPKLILIEKPICEPSLKDSQMLIEHANKNNVKMLVGYNHVVAKSTEKFCELIKNENMGNIETLDVEFREHWGGIFNAHPWLAGPSDSYLGFWQRGGGAAGEHSHAINLWQHMSSMLGAGRIDKVSAMLNYVENNNLYYDKLVSLTVRTESGLVGRIVQDVITSPPRKWARAQGSSGYVEWYCGNQPNQDTVNWGNDFDGENSYTIEKTRPDDFIREMEHIGDIVEDAICKSPISIEKGLDTMLVVAAAHLSNKEERTVTIDYSKGYSLNALLLR
jgi:predicted dehydrogenase